MRAELAEVVEATKDYMDGLLGFVPEEWCANPSNIPISNGDGNVALFEYERPGVYTGHYFLKARGKEALKVCQDILAEVFSGDVEVIRGLTPLENLGARWMNKKLGFTSYGVVKTISGPCELVILTKKEYENGCALRR